MRHIYFIIFVLYSFISFGQSSPIQIGQAKLDIPIKKDDKHVYRVKLNKNDFVQLSLGSSTIGVSAVLLIQQDTIKSYDKQYKDKFQFTVKKSGIYTLYVEPSPDTSNTNSGFYDLICEKSSKLQRKKDDAFFANEKDIITSDILNFWTAFDKLITCKTMKDSVEVFSKNYFIKASEAMQKSLTIRPMTAIEMARWVQKIPKFYASIRKNTMEVIKEKSIAENIFAKFKEIYPDFKNGRTVFLVGIHRYGGSLDNENLFIATEAAMATADCDFSELDALIYTTHLKRNKPIKTIILEIIAHECVHLQQYSKNDGSKTKCWLLHYVLMEGAADFIGEMLAGSSVNPTLEVYGKSHEKELWQLMKEDLCYGNQGKFLWNFGNPVRGDIPPDMGYYLGYKICESYYKKATNKTQAIIDIISEIDDEAFLEKSGYAEKFK